MAISGCDDHCSPFMARPADSPGRTWKITGVFTAATKVKSHPDPYPPLHHCLILLAGVSL
jgi:hypothetical protein